MSLSVVGKASGFSTYNAPQKYKKYTIYKKNTNKTFIGEVVLENSKQLI